MTILVATALELADIPWSAHTTRPVRWVGEDIELSQAAAVEPGRVTLQELPLPSEPAQGRG